MTEDAIVAVEVQETDFGEKVIINSPFDAKDFIKVLPWKEVQEEISEYGSLREKALSRGMGADNVAIDAIEDYHENEGFSSTFAAHASWEPDALGKDDGAWAIDAAAWDEASDFFEFCGFDTQNQTNL